MNLDKVREQLLAPSLSFDWEVKENEEDDFGLEVDVPEAQRSDSKRDIFHQQLRRAVSFNHAKNLTRKKRSGSFGSDTLPTDSLDASVSAFDGTDFASAGSLP